MSATPPTTVGGSGDIPLRETTSQSNRRTGPTSLVAASQADHRDRIGEATGRAGVALPINASQNTRTAPWLAGVDLSSCQHVSDVLNVEVPKFAEMMSPIPQEVELRDLTVRDVRSAVLLKYTDAVVLEHGSYMTRTWLPGGDIDVAILSRRLDGEFERSKTQHILQKMLNHLQEHNVARTEDSKVIAKASIPIITFKHVETGFKIDMSFGKAGSIPTGHLIRRHLSHRPGGHALRALVLVVKCFLALCGLNEVYTGGINSYVVVCMVIGFLQQHQMIRRGEIDPDTNIGVLTMELFEFYAFDFDYDTTAISVRDGGVFMVKQTKEGDRVTAGMLSVEDPLNTENDLAKKSFGMQRVRAVFAAAMIMMDAAAYRCGKLLSSRDAVPSRDKGICHLSCDLSLLSCIVYVDDNTLNHRRYTQRIYDDGVMHRKLGLHHPVLDKQPISSTIKKSAADGNEPSPHLHPSHGGDEGAHVDQEAKRKRKRTE